MPVMQIVPDHRHDLLVDSADGKKRRHTVYSGRLYFGGPAQQGFMLVRTDFSGQVFLPDSLPYVRSGLGDAILSSEFWVTSLNFRPATISEYLFVPVCAAQFVDDPGGSGSVWIQLGLEAQGYSGSSLGYRVTATVDVAAIRESPAEK